MAVLLSIESSTGFCSVALHDNGQLLASTGLNIIQSAASSLSIMIRDLLKLCKIEQTSLNGVAVASGPGSYTGLRIGLATAKGICYALNVPLFAINTLELMASQVISASFSGICVEDKKPLRLCPMLDARRMEVYCLLTNEHMFIESPVSARVIDDSSFANELSSGRILFFGNGAEKCKGVLKHPNALFLDGIIPSAAKLGELGFTKFTNSEAEDLFSFEPLYLKDFVAKKPKVQI